MPNDPNTYDRAEALRASIDGKSPALLAARAGVWDYDPVGDHFICCRGAANVLGFPIKESLSGVSVDRFTEIIHPDDREACLPHFVPALKEGGRINVTFRTDPAVGTPRSLLVRGDVVVDRSDFVHTSGIVVELSDGGDFSSPEGSPSPNRNSDLPRLLTAIDHTLAAREALTDLDALQDSAVPLLDMLLMNLGRALAYEMRSWREQ